MDDITTDANVLLMHYNNLLKLYNQLETISNDVFEAIGDGIINGTVQAKLKEKMTIVEAIQVESSKIADFKKQLKLSENDRVEVQVAEKKLTAIVKRVVEKEDRGYGLFQKQGVKISRNSV